MTFGCCTPVSSLQYQLIGKLLGVGLTLGELDLITGSCR